MEYLGSFINTKIHVYKLASLLIDLEYLIRQHSWANVTLAATERWFSPHFSLPVPSSHMVLVWLLNPVLNSFLPGRDRAILSGLMVWNRCRELCASFLETMFQHEGCRSSEKPPVPRGVWGRSAWVHFYLLFRSRKWVAWFYIYLLWYIFRCYHLHMI